TTSKGRNSSCVTHFARTDNGDLWISTDGSGIYCVPYGQSGGTQNKNEGLNSLLVQTIAVDKRNTLWCGSWRGGLQCYENGRFITPSYLESYREMSFMSLAYDKKNDILYAGTNGIGVLRIDLTNKTVEPYARGDENQVLWVNELFIDNDGMLWINDAMSTFVHNPKTNKTKQITFIDNVVVSTANRIQIGNRILFGTDHGLFIYDKQQQKLVDDPLTEMLKDDKITAFELSGDYLWFSSSCNKGLGCINLKTNKLTRFHSFDGFYIGEFHGGTSILLPDGNICFGGDNGIIYFDSHKILSLPQVIKPISFTSFRVGNKMVEFKENAENNILDASIFTASKAKLPMGENSFMISFSVPELTIPDRINYDYKLKGYEDDWHTTSAQDAQAYYASLPTGTYDFQVRAYFEDEPDEYSERTITIRVPAPWYASWWMTLIYLALAAAIGYYIYSVLHERRKARARLRESMQNERVKESKLRLFTSIAHELRSPLTMILSPLKQLQKEDTNPEHQENYQVMQRNCDRMLRVVNQITDVRKIDNGQFKLAFREVEYIRYANDMMASFSGLATAKNITFTSESEEKGVQVWLDPIHFEKVLTNLLSNAFKFTPTDGRILVRTTCHINGFDENNRKVFDDPHILEYLETRIYNSGSHLDDSDINHLWERFYQGNKEQSAMGSGIGLNLCYELMRLHHGHISAHNVGTDGVEFIIRLPLGNAHLKKEEIATEPLIEKTEPSTFAPETIDQEEEEKLSEEKKAVEILTATEESADTPEEDLKKTRYTVMVVDDDKELCLYVANGLRKDYNVYTANSGNEAWSLLLTHRPDVVVSDLIMPDGNGYELCRRIKENPDTDNIAVIILTSENNEDSQLQSITLQADHFLPKPFNLQLLRSALNQVLRVRETIRNKMRRTEIGHNYSAVSMDSAEEKFLKRVNDSIMSHIDDNEYGVQQLSEDVGISRVHLNRKLKEHFGISPNAFIRSIRLKHAAYLLVNNKANISEIAYKVGFSSHSYFSNNFHDYFGMTPKEFVAYYSNNLNDEALKKLLE
ncbi:MAG: response regulator, partial [Bacteroidaceae bacterium]|nr:response regulator [Bacteroidaceae bacterium]